MEWDTRLIHEAQEPDPQTGAVNVPVYLSTTFQQLSPGKSKGYVYTRTGNPTRAALERILAALEGGAGALCFASGMAGISALIMSYPAGSRIVAGDDLYHGATRILELARTHGVKVDFVDTTDLANVRKAFATGPKVSLLYLESPTNPLLKITDLKGAIAVAKRGKAIVAVDNTFASPVLQRPLELGADIVVHSMTKYLGGHSDVLGGALVLKTQALRDRLYWFQNSAGGVPSPFDSYLVIRGIRTLGVRIRQHCENAQRVAEFLEAQPKIVRTLYPGLADHPGHAIAERQMDGFGGMVSAEVAGGQAGAVRVAKKLKVFTLAESLGGVESLVNHPALMTHRAMPVKEQKAKGISGGLLRLSIGIEDADDLIDDLRQALA